MTTLEWFLIGVIVVLLAILIPALVFVYKFGKAITNIQF